MHSTQWIWHNGQVIAWDKATTHILTHSLHYGSAIFEGIRCYETPKGPALFRLQEHLERFLFSCQALKMPLAYDLNTLAEATIKIVKTNGLKSGYIRPVAYFGYGMNVTPTDIDAECAIACWPGASIVPQGLLDVKTSPVARIHPDTTVSEAKFAGHYLNSNLAALCIRGTRYHEALMLDTTGHVAEGCGQNIFMVKDGILYTPQTGHILAGITRATLLELAESLGFKTREAQLTVEDFYNADEVFFSGTAAEVAPIRSLDDKIIADGSVGPITKKLKEEYLSLVHGHNNHFAHCLTLL
ncbi:branched-chain amino acid transaminase [Piscirickettsia litoralis]|uniref:Branched-chain-amino-acid aminotransferase n=1 Tax=Piscirickettsia litoralis TaxID=1891921 RepID=A0ABX3A6B7_9GAMM|nr:branched-chain amino acid transaminase [Piscirickettsia litoralis]ODN43193.1 branched-chain-amino-acid transaminase [Piscirickettsia litoralis]